MLKLFHLSQLKFHGLLCDFEVIGLHVFLSFKLSQLLTINSVRRLILHSVYTVYNLSVYMLIGHPIFNIHNCHFLEFSLSHSSLLQLPKILFLYY